MVNTSMLAIPYAVSNVLIDTYFSLWRSGSNITIVKSKIFAQNNSKIDEEIKCDIGVVEVNSGLQKIQQEAVFTDGQRVFLLRE